MVGKRRKVHDMKQREKICLVGRRKRRQVHDKKRRLICMVGNRKLPGRKKKEKKSA